MEMIQPCILCKVPEQGVRGVGGIHKGGGSVKSGVQGVREVSLEIVL